MQSAMHCITCMRMTVWVCWLNSNGTKHDTLTGLLFRSSSLLECCIISQQCARLHVTTVVIVLLDCYSSYVECRVTNTTVTVFSNDPVLWSLHILLLVYINMWRLAQNCVCVCCQIQYVKRQYFHCARQSSNLTAWPAENAWSLWMLQYLQSI